MFYSNIVHRFCSKSEAEKILKIVARQPYHGGAKCWRLSASKANSRTIYQLEFLPDAWERKYPKGAGQPFAPDILQVSDWIQGLLLGMKLGKAK